MRFIYGKNFKSISQEAFSGTFNSWAAKKQFVCGDDISGTDKRKEIDRLKLFITQTHLSVNEKYQCEYEIKDTISYLWSSNHADVLYLEALDRRFFVHEVTVGPLPEQFYVEFDAWMRGPEGGPALFDFLMHVDLTGFNPNAAAPQTRAKSAMQQLALTDIDQWIQDALLHPDDVLKFGDIPVKADLMSLAEIKACYASAAGKEPEISSIGFARKLASHGVKMVNGSEPMYVTHRPLARYYAMKRRDHWAKASPEQAKRHLSEIISMERFRN